MPGRIHREIGEAFDAVLRKEIDRVILQCPPQHGKSTMASKRFPALALGKRPDIDIISASATASLAEEFGGEVRNCIRSHEYGALFPGVTLREDTQAKGRWATNEGGSYYAIGVGGQLFGKGAELGLIDDPFGSWEDAQSELSRKKIYDWYTGTFYNRIRPGAAVVVIQHRMHEADLVGMLAEAEKRGGDRWKVINLPADIEDPPWPERYDREALLRIKANTFDRKWNSLYMQDPTPEDGEYFKRAWFRYYTDLPESLNFYLTSDVAVTDEQIAKRDYSEIGVWGVDSADRIFCVDWWYGRHTLDITIDATLDKAKMYNPQDFVAEGGVIRHAMEPFFEKRMRERGVFVAPTWLPSSKEKAALAQSFRGLCSMGRVYFPKTDWAERVVEQLIKFPGGRYDDAVDTCSLIGRHIASVWAARQPENPKASLEGAWNSAGNLQIRDMFKKAS